MQDKTVPRKTKKNLPPPAPFGNKRAVGNDGGRPAMYTDEWIKEEAERFREWMQRPESVFFKSFAIERGYHPVRLHEFADRSPEFSLALQIAKAWQEQKLVNFGLFNKTNSTITKFVLTNCHSWKEQSQEQTDRSIVYNVNYGSHSEILSKTVPASDSTSAQ